MEAIKKNIDLELYNMFKDSLNEIKEDIKTSRVSVEKNIEDFRKEAKEAILKVEIKVDGAHIKIEEESRINLLQDKDIREMKKDNSGLGKRVNELSIVVENLKNQAVENKLKTAEGKLKLKLIYTSLGVFATALIVGVAGLAIKYLPTP